MPGTKGAVKVKDAEVVENEGVDTVVVLTTRDAGTEVETFEPPPDEPPFPDEPPPPEDPPPPELVFEQMVAVGVIVVVTVLGPL